MTLRVLLAIISDVMLAIISDDEELHIFFLFFYSSYEISKQLSR